MIDILEVALNKIIPQTLLFLFFILSNPRIGSLLLSFSINSAASALWTVLCQIVFGKFNISLRFSV